MSPAAEHAELAESAPPPAVSPAAEHAELGVSTRVVAGGGPSSDGGEPSSDGGQPSSDSGEASGGRVAATLAERQAALVAALVAGAPDPPGFDPARLAATRRALLRKRAGEAARAWPVLAASLGDRWASTFAAHHAGHEPCGALRDGWDLARTLRADVSADAAAELAERETLLRYDGVSAPRPRPLGRARLALARRLR